MNINIIKIFVFLIMFEYYSIAHAFGATEDIPFTFDGYLTITDNGFYKSSSFPTLDCGITMTGRTNSRNELATITAVAYRGRNCIDYLEEVNGSRRGPASFTWKQKSGIGVITISDLLVDMKFAYCVGDVDIFMHNDEMKFIDASLGTCRINGSLKIISKPQLSLIR